MGSDDVIKLVKDAESPEQIKDAIETLNKTQPKIRSGASAAQKRLYRPKEYGERVAQYNRDKALRESTLRNKIPFISPEVSGSFYLSQGLVLVGGISGRGKSTLAANIVAGFLNSDKKRTVTVITNEESTEAVYNRTACVLLRLNFQDFQRGRLSTRLLDEVQDVAHELTKRVDVVDSDAWDMTCLEDVQSVLEYAAEGDVGIVVIDYHQTVAFSRENLQAETYQVSKKFGLYLKDYGRKVGIPIIDFAQLKTQGKDQQIEFKDRVENDKTLYNHSFQAIEIVPDFEASQTKFIIHKDRFGYTQGRIIETKFVDGRYEAIGQDSI